MPELLVEFFGSGRNELVVKFIPDKVDSAAAETASHYAAACDTAFLRNLRKEVKFFTRNLIVL